MQHSINQNEDRFYSCLLGSIGEPFKPGRSYWYLHFASLFRCSVGNAGHHFTRIDAVSIIGGAFSSRLDLAANNFTTV
jgi:hypothetical protein